MNTTPDICSGVSQITNIYIRHKKSAQLWLQYMLGGVVGSDWTANALLMNLIISRTQTNRKMWAHTLIHDGAKLILAHTCSRMPRYWALTRFLTYSHISASSSNIIMIFTSMETSTSPLSSYVHFILLCRLPPTSARLVCGFVDPGAYELTCSSPLPPPNSTTHWRRRESGFFQSWATM